jgi:hypothetical protein
VIEPCDCGGLFKVPAWTEIQRQKGLTQEDLNPEFLIPLKIRSGELPPDHCVFCGGPGDKVLSMKAVCSEAVSESTGGVASILLLALLNFWILPVTWIFLAFRAQATETKHHGHDLVIPIPVRICSACSYSRTLSTRSSFLSRIHGPLALGALVSLFWSLKLAVVLICPGIGCYVWEVIRLKRVRRDLKQIASSIEGYAPLFRKYQDAYVDV